MSGESYCEPVGWKIAPVFLAFGKRSHFAVRAPRRGFVRHISALCGIGWWVIGTPTEAELHSFNRAAP
jgi:hypothetical protein